MLPLSYRSSAPSRSRGLHHSLHPYPNASRTKSTNQRFSMLPLRDLLNPETPEISDATPRRDHLVTTLLTTPSVTPNLRVFSLDRARSNLASRRGGDANASATPGPVNYPPYVPVDSDTHEKMAPFRLLGLNNILETSQEIPYNSSKKDLYKKTGRDKLEVFHYKFQPEGHEKPYVVMWDYEIGIVRMNPFIRYMSYPKTKPAQMLDKNAGLRDIAPSITGGSVDAQGYWIPYKCARALCATFCWSFAYALVPIFGPSFPGECATPKSPNYERMVIGQEVIIEAKHEMSRRVALGRANAEQISSHRHNRPHVSADQFVPLSRPHSDTYTTNQYQYVQPQQTQPFQPINPSSQRRPFGSSSSSFPTTASSSQVSSSRRPLATERPEIPPRHHTFTHDDSGRESHAMSPSHCSEAETHRSFSDSGASKRRRPVANTCSDEDGTHRPHPSKEGKPDEVHAARALIGLQRGHEEQAGASSSGARR